ncbi:protein phosphatase 2C domain-containing protein [Actinopolymorpha sp. B17G11]|uniref:PP2C family protein-serine/threonine phosphatase n=1 Tax=unclassified Actinopolymorpha TaxID=2627063 RepID=UPI0032D8D7E5
MRFAYSAESDLGHVRDNNEDAAFAAPHLLVVADGVGGQAAGEVASATVASVMSTISLRAITSPGDPVDLLVVLRQTIERALHTLSDGVDADQARAGMATTMTAILTDGTRFALAHVGDSRAYLLRAGELTQLTTDHTYVQVLLDKGSITPEEAKVHPHRSVVTRYVNATDRHEPQLTMLDLREGDRLLLCSDGLTDFISDERLGADLGGMPADGAAESPPTAATSPDEAGGSPKKVGGSPDNAVERLISSGLAAGGRDNITCVVADVEAHDLDLENRPTARRIGALADPENVIDLATAERAG